MNSYLPSKKIQRSTNNCSKSSFTTRFKKLPLSTSSPGHSKACLPAGRGGPRRRVPCAQGRRPGRCAIHLRHARRDIPAGGHRRLQARAVPRRISPVQGDHHRERRARGGAPARRRSHRRGFLRRAQPSAARRSRDRSASGRCSFRMNFQIQCKCR